MRRLFHPPARTTGASAPALPALMLALFLLPVILHAQEPDSTYDDMGLDPEGYTVESDLIGHYSHGWFPQPFSASSIWLTTNSFYSNVFDFAQDIRPAGFNPTTAPFTWHNPYIGNEREIMQAGQNKEEDDGYPKTDYTEYSLNYRYNLPMPAIVRGGLGLHITEGMLFSDDTTRSYLALSGIKHSLKEVGVVYLKEYMLAGSFGLEIPFYGVFLESEATNVSSYYYLHASFQGGYAIVSRATQYVQIANAKDELRYGNSRDTVTLLDNVTLGDINRFRTSVDLSLGWNFTTNFGGVALEAFVTAPITSVLDDADWKQYYVGLRFSLGYQWQKQNEGK